MLTAPLLWPLCAPKCFVHFLLRFNLVSTRAVFSAIQNSISTPPRQGHQGKDMHANKLGPRKPCCRYDVKTEGVASHPLEPKEKEAKNIVTRCSFNYVLIEKSVKYDNYCGTMHLLLMIYKMCYDECGWDISEGKSNKDGMIALKQKPTSLVEFMKERGRETQST